MQSFHGNFPHPPPVLFCRTHLAAKSRTHTGRGLGASQSELQIIRGAFDGAADCNAERERPITPSSAFPASRCQVKLNCPQVRFQVAQIWLPPLAASLRPASFTVTSSQREHLALPAASSCVKSLARRALQYSRWQRGFRALPAPCCPLC